MARPQFSHVVDVVPTILEVAGTPAPGPVSMQFEAAVPHDALEPAADQVAAHIESFIADLPAELAAQVSETGVCLTGGGALLHGIVDRLVSELRVPVWRPPDPLNAVIAGARLLAGSGIPTGA